MKTYKEFCEEQRQNGLNERFSNRGSEAALADMSRILHKPEPDFSCLTITSKELDEWYKEYYRKKSYTLKDDILLMDYGHIDNPHPLKAMKEAYGDRQPLDNIAEEMNLKYHFFEGQIKKVEASNRVSVYVAVPISDLLKADIIRDFHEGGYFCNKERIETDSFGSHYRLQFEPYIQNNVREEINRRCLTLYHYTPHSNKDSILKSGLVPSNENDFLKYPQNRTYMSIFDNPALANKIRKVNKRDTHQVIFKIDVAGIPGDIGLYYDSMAEDSVFSIAAVPPSCITLYREGNLTDKGFEVIQKW